jgi:uncharacterized membrane protein HdeD (DUF308 family)
MGNYFAPNTNGSIFRGIVALITGGVLAFVPGLTMKTVVIIIGVSILLGGLLTLAQSYMKKSSGLHGFWAAQGIFNLAIGLVLILAPGMMVNFFIVVIGIILLVLGLLQLIGAIGAVAKYGLIWFFFLNAFIMIAGGILMLNNPFKTGEAILKVLGIILMLYGFSELFSAWRISRKPKTYNGKPIEDVKYEEVK